MPAPGLMAERALGLDEEGWPDNRGHGDWAVEAMLPPVAVSFLGPGFGGFGLVHALERSGIGILDGLGVNKSGDIKAACGADLPRIVQCHHEKAAALDGGV